MDTDEEIVARLDGLFVGQLDKEELEAFNRCVVRGTACRSYPDAAGFLGLPKVLRLYPNKVD